jgi:hypothetical protein
MCIAQNIISLRSLGNCFATPSKIASQFPPPLRSNNNLAQANLGIPRRHSGEKPVQIWALGLSDSWALGLSGINRLNRLLGSRAHGFLVSWAPGLLGSLGSMGHGPIAHGLMGYRAHGLLGSCIRPKPKRPLFCHHMQKKGHFSVMCIAQNIISLRSLGNCFATPSEIASQFPPPLRSNNNLARANLGIPRRHSGEKPVQIWALGLSDSWALGLSGINRLNRLLGSRAHGFSVSWALGLSGINGLKGQWTHGLMDSWAIGLMGSWAHG